MDHKTGAEILRKATEGLQSPQTQKELQEVREKMNAAAQEIGVVATQALANFNRSLK